MNKNNYKVDLIKITTFFICIELIMMLLNNDVYFQLSGMYIPFFFVALIGCIYIMRLSVNLPTVLVIGLLILIFVQIIVNNGSINRGYCLSYIFASLLMIAIYNSRFTRKQILHILLSYSISGVLISLVMIIFHKRYYENDPTRITIQMSKDVLVDPNYLGGFLVSSAIISQILFIKAKSKVSKRVYFVMYLLNLIGVVLTGSRGAFLAYLVAGGYIYIRFTRVTYKSVVLGSIVLCLLLIIGYKYLPIETIERITNVSTWKGDSSNSRRLFLWKNTIYTIEKSPIIGYGLQGTAEINGRLGGIFEPAHNTFLEIWCQLGLFGVLDIIVLLIYSFKQRNILSKAIVVSTVIVSVFISAECTTFFFFNIAMAYAIANRSEE